MRQRESYRPTGSESCEGFQRGRDDDSNRISWTEHLFPTLAHEGLHRSKRRKRITSTLVVLMFLCICMLIQMQITTIRSFSRSTEEPANYKLRLTLVTSFWAQPEHQPKHEHRVEIEAALAANLENPHIDQVVVILDSASAEADCRKFVRQMKELRRRASSIVNKSDQRSLLTCIPRKGAQPNYFEMFNYTLHEQVRGDVVMLSNADQVFDETIATAKDIPARTLWTLSTWGYQPELVPTNLQTLYKSLVGTPPKGSDSTVGRCSARTGYYSHDLSPTSWDTYIFRPSLIRDNLKAEDFLRTKFDGSDGYFYMNEMGAENAALFALSNETSTKGELSLWNACPIIQTWHFHLAPKIHRRDDQKVWPQAAWKPSKAMLPSEFVPAPRVNAPMCHMTAECMVSRPVNVQDLEQSQSMKGKKIDEKLY